jgi:hypothetical protein
MYQQLWGYKVEEKLYLEVREQKRLNTIGLDEVPSALAALEPRGSWCPQPYRIVNLVVGSF